MGFRRIFQGVITTNKFSLINNFHVKLVEALIRTGKSVSDIATFPKGNISTDVFPKEYYRYSSHDQIHHLCSSSLNDKNSDLWMGKWIHHRWKNQRVFFCQSIAWCRSKVVPIKELQCGTRRTESTVIPLYQLECTRPFVHHISLRLVQLSLKASLFSIGSLASHLLRGSNARKTNDISTSASTLHFSIMEI